MMSVAEAPLSFPAISRLPSAQRGPPTLTQVTGAADTVFMNWLLFTPEAPQGDSVVSGWLSSRAWSPAGAARAGGKEGDD